MTTHQTSIARLGSTHGYCFDGDEVELNAELFCCNDALCGQSWSLQLLAGNSDTVAELTLGQIFPDHSGYIAVSGQTSALIPAGVGNHQLTLVLRCDGNEVDRAEYAAPASFALPHLAGNCEVTLNGDSAEIRIDSIINPRAEDNLSGTLALEIWALDSACSGNQWTGTPLASMILGQLAGQQTWQDVQHTLHATAAPANSFPTLMLREWTTAGYVTRDFRSLAVAVSAPASAAEVAVAAPAAKPAKKAAETAKPAAKAAVAKAPEKASAAAAAASTAAAVTVSVNKASAAEITAVKGVSDALARAIVASRPYASLDELTRAKGMGPKLLAKLRASFSL